MILIEMGTLACKTVISLCFSFENIQIALGNTENTCQSVSAQPHHNKEVQHVKNQHAVLPIGTTNGARQSNSPLTAYMVRVKQASQKIVHQMQIEAREDVPPAAHLGGEPSLLRQNFLIARPRALGKSILETCCTITLWPDAQIKTRRPSLHVLKWTPNFLPVISGQLFVTGFLASLQRQPPLCALTGLFAAVCLTAFNLKASDNRCCGGWAFPRQLASNVQHSATSYQEKWDVTFPSFL